MSTRIVVAVNDQADGYQSGQQAAQDALADLGSNLVSLALLFTSHAKPTVVLRGARVALGSLPLIGATTAGQYTHDRYVEEGTGILLIQSDDMQFHPLQREQPWSGHGSLLDTLRGLSENGLGSSLNNRLLLLFADDQSMDLEHVLDRAMTETRMLYDILGGTSVTLQSPARPAWLFHGASCLAVGLTGSEILSQQPMGIALADGWSPISGPYRVTRVEGRRVVLIDGRPAREVYEDFFQEHAVNVSADNVDQILLHYPLGMCDTGYCKARVLGGFDDTGALISYAPPREHSLVYILSTTPEAMIDAASRTIRQAQAALGGRGCAGGLFIDCLSNGLVLDDRYSQQRQVVQQAMRRDSLSWVFAAAAYWLG